MRWHVRSALVALSISAATFSASAQGPASDPQQQAFNYFLTADRQVDDLLAKAQAKRDNSAAKQAEQSANYMLKLAQDYLRDQPAALAIAERKLAFALRLQGRYVQAQQHAEAALASATSAQKPREVAAALNELGHVQFALGRLDRAEAFWRQCREKLEADASVPRAQLAQCLINLASVREKRQDYDGAEKLFLQALAGLPPSDFRAAEARNDLALIYIRRGQQSSGQAVAQGADSAADAQLDRAEAELAQALKIAQDLERAGTTHRDFVANVQDNLATVYLYKGDLKKAAEADAKGTRSLAGGDLEALSGTRAPAAYLRHADICWATGQKDQAIQDVAAALKHADEQRELAAKREGAQGLSPEESIARADFFSQLFAAAYARMARWQLELNHPVDAWVACEQGRARSLLDEISVVEHPRGAGEAQTALFDNFKPDDLKKVQNWLDEQRGLLLEYLLGEQGCYVFVLSGNRALQAVKLEVVKPDSAAFADKDKPSVLPEGALTADGFYQALLSMKKAAYAKDDSRQRKQAAAMWRILVPPEVQQRVFHPAVQHLYIVPDGALAELPFEILPVEESESPRYLLDVGAPVAYGPSATVLMKLDRGTRPWPSGGPVQPVLTVGEARNVPNPPGRKFEPLEYDTEEMRGVATAFQKAMIPVAELRGDAATEAGVRANVVGRRLIHFACHGWVDPNSIRDCNLALTPGNTSSGASDDGRMTLAELYELDMQGCDLVIASACDTNSGKAQRGEGVWALTRGLLGAGADRVVAANFPVDDKASARLIEHFCQGIANARAQGTAVDYARLLQASKRWVRSKAAWHDDPFFWGGFVLMGAN